MPFKKSLKIFLSILITGLAVYGIYAAVAPKAKVEKGTAASSQEQTQQAKVTQQNQELATTLDTSTTNENLSKKDSDSDGLPDAAETIYKTDPFDPDTDNDKYLDGEEVKNGYDPTIPSPNDKIFSKENSQGEVAGATTGINIEKYFPLNNQLNIINPSNKDTVSSYFELSSKVLMPSLNELGEATASAQKGDASGLLTVLAKIDSGYKELLKIPVPEETLQIHKESLAEIKILRQNLATFASQANKDAYSEFQSKAKELKIFVDATRTKIQELMNKYQITL